MSIRGGIAGERLVHLPSAATAPFQDRRPEVKRQIDFLPGGEPVFRVLTINCSQSAAAGEVRLPFVNFPGQFGECYIAVLPQRIRRVVMIHKHQFCRSAAKHKAR